jgi:hypothetical protein
MSTLPTMHLLYENEAWLPPLREALAAEGFPVKEHLLWRGSLDPRRAPEDGLWWNRMSPSSHTRGHAESVPWTREVLAWLEGWGRRVVNGSRAFEIEVSKSRQEGVLRRHDIRSPRTVLGNDREALVHLARTFTGPFITKHNQGGKGLGIALFRSSDELGDHLASGVFDAGPTGQIVLQEYIRSPEPYITRVEIVAGRFLYAMRSCTEDGFELCPSDACQIPAHAPAVCPADGEETPLTASGRPKFLASDLTEDDPLVRQLIELCRAEGIEQAGIEFIEDEAGLRYVYDINGTTNYASSMERHFGTRGMAVMARYLRGVASGDQQPQRWGTPTEGALGTRA